MKGSQLTEYKFLSTTVLGILLFLLTVTESDLRGFRLDRYS